MKWVGWLCWHIGDWLDTANNRWYAATSEMPGWAEANERDIDKRDAIVRNRVRCIPLNRLLERTTIRYIHKTLPFAKRRL